MSNHSFGPGLMFLLVGPGGAGKNTLMKEVLPRLDNLYQLATATTRLPRPGEEEGREHRFVTLDEFKQLMASNGLVEYEEVHPGKFYGVPREPLERAFREGYDLIADVELAGAQKVKAEYPDNTVMIFIAPPHLDVLEDRMRSRGESEQGITDRMSRYEREMAFAPNCDITIVNADVTIAAQELYDYLVSVRERRPVQA